MYILCRDLDCDFQITLTESKTPTRTPGGDRFIPNRNATDFEVGNYKLVSDLNHEDEQLMSPSKLEYRRVMNENLNGKAMDSKILRFKQAVPSAPEGNITWILNVNTTVKSYNCFELKYMQLWLSINKITLIEQYWNEVENKHFNQIDRVKIAFINKDVIEQGR